MAQLKDLIVNGASRFIGDIFGTNATFSGDVMPETDNTQSLGDSTHRWKLYGTITGSLDNDWRIKINNTQRTYNGSADVDAGSIYAPTTGGTANTQALVGNGATTAPKWVNISPSISITAGTSSATPKVNVTVLGQSGTAQAITTATTGVYGATKLTDAYTSTDATLAATGKSILAAIQTLDVSAVGVAAATGNRFISQISEADGKISAILATATIGGARNPIYINAGTLTAGAITFDTLNANRLMWTTAADKPYAGYHYADSTHVAINSSAAPAADSNNNYNFYVSGTSGFNIGTSDNTSHKRIIVYGNNRYLSIGASGLQTYTGATDTNTASLLYLQYNGGDTQFGHSTSVPSHMSIFGNINPGAANTYTIGAPSGSKDWKAVFSRNHSLCANNAWYGDFYIGTIGTANSGDNNETRGTQGEVYLRVGNNVARPAAGTAGGENNARGRVRIYNTSTGHVDIFSDTWSGQNLNVVSDTNSTAGSTGQSYVIVGNANKKSAASASSTGRLRLYGDENGYHDIYPTSATSNYIHYIPNSTGWIATGGNGTSTGAGSSSQPVYLSASGVITAITGAIANNTTGSAATLTTGRTFSIADNDATNTGPASSAFNGSANLIINLPATIKASLSGNATTATRANITTTTNAIAKYSNTTGTFANSGATIDANNNIITSGYLKTTRTYPNIIGNGTGIYFSIDENWAGGKGNVCIEANTMRPSDDSSAAGMSLGLSSQRWGTLYVHTSVDLKDSNNNYTFINPGYMEISHSSTPFIDFHRANSAADYTARIIAGADGSSESLVMQSQTIVLQANGKSAALYSTGDFTNWNGNIYAGGDNAEREYDVIVRSKAGQIYLYSQGTTTGNRGIYSINASGTGQGVLSISQDGNVYLRNGSVYVTASGSSEVLYGAAWNDYAEYRKTDATIEPGRCIIENGDDSLRLSTKRLERGCEIVSDTFGFAIGQTDECQTPTAASGRVLAYIYEGREAAATHIGWPVCSGPDGTVSIMTEEEEEKYPSRIIGTISAVPDYKTWNDGNVQVNGRVWIRIR